MKTYTSNLNKSLSKGKGLLTERKTDKKLLLKFKGEIVNNKKIINKKKEKNYKKNLKPVLRSSKINIEQKKDFIKKIIEESLNMDKILYIQSKNDLFLYESSVDAQSNYDIEIEKIFKEKMEKLNEINTKYDKEIFELKSKEEEIKLKNKDNDDTNSDDEENDIKVEEEKYKIIEIYKKLNEDKNKEIENLDKQYIDKYNKLYDRFIYNFEFEELDERNMIYKNLLYENIKTKICDVINPTNKKTVKFNFDSQITHN